MRRHLIMLVLLAPLFTRCSVDGTALPLMVSGHQPAQLARERAYLACATALYHALGRELRLRQAYQSKVVPVQSVRVFHLDGYVLERGARHPARFVCTTERFGRTRVLSLTGLGRALID